MMLLYTGMMIGELVDLEWDGVDFEARLIVVIPMPTSWRQKEGWMRKAGSTMSPLFPMVS